MKSLNVIGCGTVGKVVGRLFQQAGVFRVGDILNRTPESGQNAAAFIGAGRPLAGLAEMGPADLYLIASSDDAITGCAQALAASGLIDAQSVVFQLSGVLPSASLEPVRILGAQVVSVHPVKSFVDPLASVASFSGTCCGIEGDAPAVALLSEAFGAIGGRVFALDPSFKSVYHAGSVLVCNYLTSLIELGVKAYGKGGLSRDTALQVMEPLVRGTLDNVFSVGTEQALTGPIARGDSATVAGQLCALEAWDGEMARIYRALGRVAVELSVRRGVASPADLAALTELLAEKG